MRNKCGRFPNANRCTEKTMKLHAAAKANSMGGRKGELKVKLFGVKNGKATNSASTKSEVLYYSCPRF